MIIIWRIQSGCYEHSKQCDCNLLYLDSLFVRWLSTFNIKTASNAKQRSTADTWSYCSFTVENAPFQFKIADKKSHYEIRSATWGYINNLPEFVLDLLDNLDR